MASEEEQIALELIYEPNVPDAHRQYMSEDTIEKGCQNFEENRKKGVVKANLFHVKATDDIEILRTFTMPIESEIGGYKVTKGTWLGEMKYISKSLWEARKAGTLAGVSIGGRGVVHEAKVKQKGE